MHDHDPFKWMRKAPAIAYQRDRNLQRFSEVLNECRPSTVRRLVEAPRRRQTLTPAWRRGTPTRRFPEVPDGRTTFRLSGIPQHVGD
jgi:hypothetical protein